LVVVLLGCWFASKTFFRNLSKRACGQAKNRDDSSLSGDAKVRQLTDEKPAENSLLKTSDLLLTDALFRRRLLGSTDGTCARSGTDL